MRILLITNEEWNDYVYGNNVLTNWFRGFDAEFAQIYCSPGLPYNTICNRYFRITDMQMLQSIFPGKRKAGCVVAKPTTQTSIEKSKQNLHRQGAYRWLKKLSLYIHTPMMLLNDAIWSWGHYDLDALRKFVVEFNPDVVFCPRFISPKLMRLEIIISQMTNAPFVAFTADNEASLNHYGWSPLFWLRQLYVHRLFKKHVQLYKHYFMFSEEQAQEYAKEYNLQTSCLYKCGSFKDNYTPKQLNSPIRMMYAGRLYCNRWKTLSVIGDAMRIINQDGVKIFLDVYTTEKLSSKQCKALSQSKYIYVHDAIPADQLQQEYERSDIALHVESFDKSNRLATHYSFSTKIIDLMASSCAIMAVCWEKHAGYQYLKEKDAAICISSYSEILPTLTEIIKKPNIIEQYAQKAWNCGKTYHTRKVIHSQINTVFQHLVEDNAFDF